MTNWSLVPTQLWRCSTGPDLTPYDLVVAAQHRGRQLGVAAGAAAPRPGSVAGAARAEVSLGYGMTETNGLGTSLGPPLTYTHPESVGRPNPGVEVEVRDPV